MDEVEIFVTVIDVADQHDARILRREFNQIPRNRRVVVCDPKHDQRHGRVRRARAGLAGGDAHAQRVELDEAGRVLSGLCRPAITKYSAGFKPRALSGAVDGLQSESGAQYGMTVEGAENSDE